MSAGVAGAFVPDGLATQAPENWPVTSRKMANLPRETNAWKQQISGRTGKIARVSIGQTASHQSFIELRTYLSDTYSMNGNELLKRLRKIARGRRLQLQLVRERGKGSHGTLYLGDRFTIMKDRKKEIGPGLLKKMLTDLGLDKSDVEQ